MLNVECHTFEYLFTEYFGMPFICTYLIVIQIVTHLLVQLLDSTVLNVECHTFEHLFTEYFVVPYIC